MSENQFDASQAQVDVGAQPPAEAPVESEQSGESTEERRDASGRVLYPWESTPKAAKSE